MKIGIQGSKTIIIKYEELMEMFVWDVKIINRYYKQYNYIGLPYSIVKLKKEKLGYNKNHIITQLKDFYLNEQDNIGINGVKKIFNIIEELIYKYKQNSYHILSIFERYKDFKIMQLDQCEILELYDVMKNNNLILKLINYCKIYYAKFLYTNEDKYIEKINIFLEEIKGIEKINKHIVNSLCGE